MNLKQLAVVLCVLVSTNVFAMSGTTVGGHIACLNESQLDDITSFVVAEDKASVEAYIRDQKCIVLKKGLKVTVTKSPGMFGTKTEFAFQGLKLWTYREAIRYGD